MRDKYLLKDARKKLLEKAIPRRPSYVLQIEAITTNARIKTYPTQTVLQVCNRSIFRDAGWEKFYTKPKRAITSASTTVVANPERSLTESRRRARAAVRDIALCNGFTYMFTWTLNAKIIDRYDADNLKEKLRTFLSNATQRKEFEYICVPEYHKDGAIHIHGLCNLGKVQIVPALKNDGTQRTTNNRPVFNMPDWKFGYSTCVPIDDNYERACNYVAKYINKADSKIFGKWYLSSRHLKKRPDIANLERMDYEGFRIDNPSLAETTLYGKVCLVSKHLEEGSE